MNAIIMNDYGDTNVLEYKDMPIPTIGDSQVLIKTQYAAINPMDWKIRLGYIKLPQLPYIMGLEGAGTVIQKGALVSSLEVGDTVMARIAFPNPGTYAEYFAAELEHTVKLPGNVDMKAAAGVSLAGSTAWASLFDFGELKKGQTILVQGASGGVGSMAVQLAKLVGAQVIAITSTQNIELVKSYGADQILDYKTQKVEDLVSGVDVILDTVGGKASEGLWKAIRTGGIFVSIVESEDLMSPLAKQYGVKAIHSAHKISGMRMEQLASLMSKGKLNVNIDSEYSLAEAAKAHERSQLGHVCGKIILSIKN